LLNIFLIITGSIPKKNTLRNYQRLISQFSEEFGERPLESISSEEITIFLNKITAGKKQSTKRLRYALISSFFNLMKNSFDPNLKNPCENTLLKKMFRLPKHPQWKILDKEVVDELIFRTVNLRDRVMLELMAKGGMRIGEVLKMRPSDILESKIILREPKSGRDVEYVFIPQKLAEKLREYVRTAGISQEERIFPISYTTARKMVRNAGDVLNVNIKPHDLRRYAATYASRSGTPLEIVSKLIMRHSNISTTQRYLGKVSDVEAMRWIENLYA
ncbi:tyrosine-type recombinase/integrase, partial [Thermodesulfobacteriota bacterium]